MTAEEVEYLVRSQIPENFTAKNDHSITLQEALIRPRRIFVIARAIGDRRLKDEEVEVWLVGEEKPINGYKIVMRDDGLQFGLASPGFPEDRYPILCGWYGSLISTFLGM
jgi:hypothetical protein